MFSQEKMTTLIADVDVDAYDNKVIKDYLRKDGSLKTIPAQKKKLEAVLRHIVKAFKVGKRYSKCIEHAKNERVNNTTSNYPNPRDSFLEMRGISTNGKCQYC